MLEFEPVISASKPWCLTLCAMGTIRSSDKCQLIHKMYGIAEIRTRTLWLKIFCPNPAAEICFSIKKYLAEVKTQNLWWELFDGNELR